MSGILAVVLLTLSGVKGFLQDPFQTQIDDALRQFETAAEVDQALTHLSSQLMALGVQATNPIARRLAHDLRDGMASAAAPAFIDALVGRPDALGPLQTAFRDAATSAAGRIELAEALLHLDDAMSWRAGLIAIASDEKGSMSDRLHASRVLLEAEDPRIPDLLRGIVDKHPGRTDEERQQVEGFLMAANTPLTRELLGRISAARPGSDEPRVKIIDNRPRSPSEPVARAIGKKKETRGTTFFTIPSILAGGVTLLLLGLLLIEILRKG